MRRHDCYCTGRPWCLTHKADEWGGGERDICAAHGHERHDDQPTQIDVERLARAMTGIVFMDAASNRRVASAIARNYSAEPDTETAGEAG